MFQPFIGHLFLERKQTYPLSRVVIHVPEILRELHRKTGRTGPEMKP